jgi:hypothetical protein
VHPVVAGAEEHRAALGQPVAEFVVACAEVQVDVRDGVALEVAVEDLALAGAGSHVAVSEM